MTRTEKIVALWRAGTPLKAIAARFHRSSPTIHCAIMRATDPEWVRVHNLKRRIRRMKNPRHRDKR